MYGFKWCCYNGLFGFSTVIFIREANVRQILGSAGQNLSDVDLYNQKYQKHFFFNLSVISQIDFLLLVGIL